MGRNKEYPDEAFTEAAASAGTYREIAEMVGCTIPTAYQRCSTLGITPNKSKRQSADVRDKTYDFINRYYQKRPRAISRELGITYNALLSRFNIVVHELYPPDTPTIFWPHPIWPESITEARILGHVNHVIKSTPSLPTDRFIMMDEFDGVIKPLGPGTLPPDKILYLRAQHINVPEKTLKGFWKRYAEASEKEYYRYFRYKRKGQKDLVFSKTKQARDYLKTRAAKKKTRKKRKRSV